MRPVPFVGPLEPLDVRWSRAHKRADRCQWGWREAFLKDPPSTTPRARDLFPEEQRSPVTGKAVPLSLSTLTGGVTGGWTLCGRHTFWVRNVQEAREVEEALHCEWHLWDNEPAEAIHGDELPPSIERAVFSPETVGYHWPCPKVTCGLCCVNRDRILDSGGFTTKYRGADVVLTFFSPPTGTEWEKSGLYQK